MFTNKVECRIWATMLSSKRRPQHIEETRSTMGQAERLWNDEDVPEADPDDTRELLNYRSAFEFDLARLKGAARQSKYELSI